MNSQSRSLSSAICGESPIVTANHESVSAQPVNRTRRTADLIAKFKREGRWHLIPLYYFLRLSDFAREGIENSGSHRFADHMYRAEQSGNGWLGRTLDRVLLNLRATRAMRSRCARAIEEMKFAFEAHAQSRPFRVLTVPCGIPRDVRDFASRVDAGRIDYTGLDIDPAVVCAARDFLSKSTIRTTCSVEGDALNAATWPAGSFDFISSTGLGEFLDDRSLLVFYRNVHGALESGGTFYTSAAAEEPRSNWLLRAFEFDVHYRVQDDLERMLAPLAWRSIEFSHDSTGLQTFVRAVKA
jgi:SAM-dependent methyltransferase